MSDETEHIENIHAYDEEFNGIYIGDVPYEERGKRKAYFCLGCKRRMVAVVGTGKRKKHFRHDVVRKPGEKKCTYSDETYRHDFAKQFIQKSKKIKVPALYKIDPSNRKEPALLLREAKIIEGTTVLVERYIYEDESGHIVYQGNRDSTGKKTLLIKPDAILLDEKDNPILIVEFVATHKPDVEKITRLKRLGIDAVQLFVPKSSLEEIEKSFSVTKNTKWIYNQVEDETNYLEFSNSYSGGIFEIDDEQRRLFEEGFKCRKAQLRSLIRTIEQLLEGEHYKRVERKLESELFRIKKNAKEHQRELDEIREGYIQSGIEKHREGREDLKKEQEKFRRRVEDLDRRYRAKRGNLERDIAAAEFNIRRANTMGEEIGGTIANEEREIESLEREIQSIEAKGERTGEDIRKTEKEIKEKIGNIDREIQALQKTFGTKERELEQRVRENIRTAEEHTERLRNEAKRIPELFERDRARLEQQYKSIEETVRKEIEAGENNSDGWTAEVYKQLYEFERAILVYKEAHEFSERVEQKLSNKA